MAQHEDAQQAAQIGNTDPSPTTSMPERSGIGSKPFSKHISDHLANERTFLAWIRTGIALITFGFVIARFGLFLRELTLKNVGITVASVHISSIIGVLMVLLGVAVIGIALLNFMHIRRCIDQEMFRPSHIYPILLTVLTGIVGTILAVYLLFTG